MTSKRLKVSIIYFVVVILTLLMRVASALDIYSALGIDDADAFWSCTIQIVIFGVVPFVMYVLWVAGKEDKLLPYFPAKQKKKDEENDADCESVVDAEYARDDQPATAEFSASAALDSDAQQYQSNEVANEVAEVAEPAKEKKGQKVARACKALLHDFGFKKISFKGAVSMVVLAVCMIIIGSGVSMLWQAILSLMGYTHSSSDTQYSSIWVLVEELVLVAVLPGFFEEFSHRGLLFAGFKETGWKFVLLSALFFSLMHQNIVQTGYTFVDGISMALVMYYTGSIWPSMFMHFLNNAWSVFIGYVSDNGGVFSFIIQAGDWLYSSLGGLIVCVLAVLIATGLAVFMFWILRNEAVKNGRIDSKPFKNTNAYPLAHDLLFWLIVAVGVAATTFSFVWGILR